MRRGFRRKRAWRGGELGVDAASRRRGHLPEHTDPLFNYIAGTVLPAGYEREEPKQVRRRRRVVWLFGVMVAIWVVFLFVESPV